MNMRNRKEIAMSESEGMYFQNWFNKQVYSEKYKFYCYEAWCAALNTAKSVPTSTNTAMVPCEHFRVKGTPCLSPLMLLSHCGGCPCLLPRHK